MKHRANLLNRDTVSALILLLLAIWIWYLSSSFPDLPEGYPGPKLFPRIIAVGLALIGLALGIGRMLRRSESAAEEPSAGEPTRPLNLGLGILFLAAFPLISPQIGFVPALLLTGALLGMALQLVWWRALLTAALTVGFIYLIFSKLLNVPL